MKAALFDLDGTLVESHSLVFVAVREAVAPFRSAGAGARPPTDDEIVATFGPVERGTIEAFVAPADVPAALERFFETYGRLLAALRPYAGVPETLRALRARGVRVGVATGRSRRGASMTLRAAGLGDEFEEVVTGDDVARPKPDPECVAILARRLGTPPAECVYVGDMEVDVRAARGAGCRSAAALWGARDPAALRAARPDILLARPEDLIDL